jgi:hypothetical protein
LQVAPLTTNAWTLAPQTTKKFKKCSFYRNIPIILMPRVIFQLKKIKIKKLKQKKLRKKKLKIKKPKKQKKNYYYFYFF